MSLFKGINRMLGLVSRYAVEHFKLVMSNTCHVCVLALVQAFKEFAN